MRGLTGVLLIWSSLMTGQVFHFSPLPALPDPAIQRVPILYQSRDHRMWMGTEKGLYTFDGRRYSFVARPDGQHVEVTAMAEGPDGLLWTGYADGYLHIHGPQRVNRTVNTGALQKVAITSVLFHPNGDVLITTYGNGLWRLRENLTRISEPSLATISDIYDAVIGPDGIVWLATDDGVWKYKTTPSERVTHLDKDEGLPDDIVTRLCVAKNGDVWVALYDHGLVRYSAPSEVPMIEKSFSSGMETVAALDVSPRGQAWLATDQGLYLCTPNLSCRTISLPRDLTENIDELFVDQGGHLWLSSGKSLFFINTELASLDPGLNGIQAVAVTSTTLWAGSDKGLIGIQKSSGQIQPHLQGFALNILSLYPDPQGRLWIGTFGQGLYVYDPVTGKLRHLTEARGISNNSILNIDGKDHQVWLATLGGITAIRWDHDLFREPLSIRRFQDEFDFTAGYVYDVHAGVDGRVWFGTDGQGLYFLDGSSLQKFDIQVDTLTFPDDDFRTIYSVATAEDSSVWVSSALGSVYQVDLDGRIKQKWGTTTGIAGSLQVSGDGDVLMVADGMIRVHQMDSSYMVFDESIGLAGFTPHINATAYDPDGSVWIAGTDRIYHYVSAAPDARRQVVMHLESDLAGQNLGDGSVRLKPDSNFLDVRFVGLWYEDPGKVRYRYRLQGHDQDWIYTREGRAVYSRLSPGHYTFRVEGTHQDHFLNAGSLEFGVQVLPPVYRRWWFITALVLAAAAGLFGFIRGRIRRINKLHQLEREKTMLQLHAIQAQVNPHFLFNSFNTLSSIIEEDQHAAVDYLDQLAGFFRGVLMHRNAELIRLDEEVDIVRHYARLLQKRYGENLRILEDIQHTSGLIAPLSIQLLVENAIKHNTVSSEKPLSVCITIAGDWVSVSNRVQPKFQSSTESTGFGLSSLLTRYQYLTSRRIEIREDQNTFTVRIPIIHAETES